MQIPVNKNASNGAKNLLSYLCSISGKGMIAGQHTQTNYMEEAVYIQEKTGKQPKLRGFELLAYSPNINYDDASYDCLKEIYENRAEYHVHRKPRMGMGECVIFSPDF